MSDTSMTPLRTTLAGTPLAVWLTRLLAMNAVALYAGAISLLHKIQEVPIHQTWMIGVVGFILLFLVIGVIITGKPLGFFMNEQQQLSPDWLPLLLIWPVGLSLWSCLALDLASIQTKQQLGNGIALPFMLLMAAVPPLLLARLPAWPTPQKSWQRICDAQYALATFTSACILCVALSQALLHDAPVITPQPSSPLSAPALSKPTQGFICNPNTKVPESEDNDSEDNRCEPTSNPATTSETKAVSTTSSTKVIRPIDHYFSLWGSLLLLVGACVLIIGRKLGGGVLNKQHLLELSVSDAGTLSQISSLTEGSLLGQIAPLLRGSGVPGGDVLANIFGELSHPSATSTASTSTTPNATVPAPIPSALPTAEPVANHEVAATPVTASPTTEKVEESPTSTADETKLLQNQVIELQNTLIKQETSVQQFQDSLGKTQEKLEQQAAMLNQFVEEAQHNHEESRRTSDSLTRLMQSIKADVDRLSKNQASHPS